MALKQNCHLKMRSDYPIISKVDFHRLKMLMVFTRKQGNNYSHLNQSSHFLSEESSEDLQFKLENYYI